MRIEYRFLSILELDSYLSSSDRDSENLLSTGLDLYKKSIVSSPHWTPKDPIVCIALADDVIVGRFMLFRSKIKACTELIDVQTSGGLLVSENYRGLGIGKNLFQTVLKNDFYLGALYTRPAYNIIKKTEVMLEIPQYVRYLYKGFKRILDIPIYVKNFFLRRRLCIERLDVVPDWVDQLIMNNNYKYMEQHDALWLQWALDSNATGNETDYQSFYALYNKDRQPIGFFMTKTRTIEQDGIRHKKANLVEWAFSDISKLDEADINILALSTLEPAVVKFWTITENSGTQNKLLRYQFKRKGWFAMGVRMDERFEDIGDVMQWRIRYGCSNTAIVE